MSDHDYYGEAWRLIAMMTVEGFADAARTLDDAVTAGFTATEILMALRWHIDRFLETEPDCSASLAGTAKNLRVRLDRALA